MGGKVFSSGLRALYTPRLTREVYQRAQQQCFAALRPLFPLIQCPIEAPEKTTFGDIDVLACLEGSAFAADEISDPDKTAVWAAVERALRAVRTYQENRLVKNFALPWPAVPAQAMARQLAVETAAGGDKAVGGSDEAVALGGEAEKEAGQKPRYIQVDVQLYATKQELDWAYFKLAYGDLCNLLCAILWPCGLTISSTALCIRIPEIERHQKKRARVFLTDKPIEVLNFLGLPHENGQWGVPFASIEQLFEYAARCRWSFLWPREGEDDRNAKQGAALRKLKHNDRQRMRQRPIFARWFDEFIPAGQAAGRFAASGIYPATDAEATVLRDKVRAAAFREFPGAEAAWEDQLAAWHAENARIFVRNTLIKTDACLPRGPGSLAHVLPAPQEGGGSIEDIEENWRGALRSALVRIVVNQDCGGFEDVVAAAAGGPPAGLRDERGVLRADEVMKWIEDNWEAVGRVAWRENCARAKEAFRVKEERRKKDE